jgi:nitrite reductase/ring-hydroxylating ferredoxin subunit
VPEEDVELSHVGPDTPCGEYLRRFWQPICFSDELKDLPHRVKILGEELVAFRDRSGAVGLLELHCPHRGASLEYGLIDAKGIRCCYHGWLFAADGTILETPGEPAHSTLKDRLCHGAYPTHEYGGIVFAYMGPPDLQPSFPVYDSFLRSGYQLVPGPKYAYPCNWLQTMENAMDPAHTAFLHTIVSGAQFTDEFWRTAGTGVRRDASGYDVHWHAAGRTECLGADGRSRSAEPAAGGPDLGDRPPGAWVQRPDAESVGRAADTTTMFFELRHVSETEGVTPAWWADGTNMAPAQLAADSYEAGQRQPGDYEAQVSQRPIAIHALEHIGATDRGVMMFRNQTRRGIRAVQAGHDPTGLCRDAGMVIPTYCNDTVTSMPPDGDPTIDRRRMRETGLRLADGYLKAPPLLASWPSLNSPPTTTSSATS